jgi:hypothetical protein
LQKRFPPTESDPTLTSPEILVTNQDLHQIIDFKVATGNFKRFIQTATGAIHTLTAIAQGTVEMQLYRSPIIDLDGVLCAGLNTAIVSMDAHHLTMHQAWSQKLTFRICTPGAT